jgi:hypothetical protein
MGNRKWEMEKAPMPQPKRSHRFPIPQFPFTGVEP